MEHGGTLERRFHVENDRERFVVDDHKGGGVLPLVSVAGHDDGDRLTDEAHDVGGEKRAGHGGRQHGHVEREQPQIEVGGREHTENPRRVLRFGHGST